MRTSSVLRLGDVYTRADLRSTFKIRAASLNNGIFHPSGHESVWLFVTREKTRDRTPYRDKLTGNTLEMDGQQEGGTDSLVINHQKRDLELLLFSRTRRDEFPRGGFRFLGKVEYLSHEIGRPTHFTLRLQDSPPVPKA